MAKLLTNTKSSDLFPKELAQLRTEVEQLPRSIRDRLLPLCDKICHFLCLEGRLLEIAQETVDRMHLESKCLQFDLDVTRNERDELRGELENLTEGW